MSYPLCGTSRDKRTIANAPGESANRCNQEGLLQIFLKVIERAVPGKLGSFRVVAWCGVIMKAVLLAFVDVGYEFLFVLF